MYRQLQAINHKPEAFEFYSADQLWTGVHTSGQMLSYHLNESVDLASRNHAFIERSLQWICDHFAMDSNTRVCDFGCGPGLYTSGYAKSGAQVTGVDFSENSLNYAEQQAKQQGLTIDYVQQNYLHYASAARFDLISLIMCDFCALSPAQRRQLLAVMHQHLADGGRLLLDVLSTKAYDAREESALYEHRQLQGFWSENDYYGFLSTFKYPQEQVVLDKYTIVEESGSRVIYNWLQYFSEEALTAELSAAGFRIEALYGDVAGTPYSGEQMEFAVVAVKA